MPLTAVTVALAFAAVAPAAFAQTIEVTPSTGLVRSGQNVTVGGTGFAPGDEIGIQQCRNAPGSATCAELPVAFQADASGSFSGPVFVRYTPSGLLSCEDPYCTLYALGETTVSNRASISFAGSTSTTSTPSPGHRGSVPSGEPVTDTGVVTGNATDGSPTGTMSFFVCGPDHQYATCDTYAGGVALPGNPRPLAPAPNNTASAISGQFTPTAPGRYCFRSVYSGSAAYGVSYDASDNECFFAKVPSTTKMTVSTPWVPIGEQYSYVPRAVVTGTAAGGSPTGNVANWYCHVETPATCESGGLFDHVTAVTPGPNNTSAASFGNWVSLSPGRTCFRAEYRGDSRYFPSSGAGPDACVVVGGYPRPRSASPVRVSLVPAATPCTSPNTTHGPPLSFGSCTPPVQQSGHLTVGTPDSATPRPSNSVGHLRLRTILDVETTSEDESDVEVTVSLTDVRNRSDLSDYAGELDAGTTLRVTDHFTPVPPYGNGPATVEDFRLAVAVPCAGTADTRVGSTCAVNTTAEALIPGAVAKLGRAIWATGPVRINDGGSDGDADTTADNALFATQGVFIP